MATRKIRVKKLNARTPLPVLFESEIDLDEEQHSNEYQSLSTGVEQQEEQEIHLQEVLKGAGVAADKEIPVPPPQKSDLNYEELYSQLASKPATYIRFSQTVEECVSCLYDLTEEDDAFLIAYNECRPDSEKLSDDDFERIMEVFEDTSSSVAPFASVDQTILPYEEMLTGLQDLQTKRFSPMPHAQEIYEYWKSRRHTLGNKPLHPTLKVETHQETDDLDPYVCFRRREVRQTRKTRARDVQSTEKLKRLRKELEEGRQLIMATYTREVFKAEILKLDRQIYEQRAQLKDHKKRLNIRTDDEDLINVRPQKRKVVEAPSNLRQPPSTSLRLSARQEARPSDSDLLQLADRLAEKENELFIDIRDKVKSHKDWNRNYVDLTRGPLSPVKKQTADVSFRPAKTQYLMTPPASVSSGSVEEPNPMNLDKVEDAAMVKFRGAAVDSRPSAEGPAYRRRIGRLNRLWIDRRGLEGPTADKDNQSDPWQSDRWMFDQDSEDEEEPPVYEMDPYETIALRFRASIPLPGWGSGRQVQVHKQTSATPQLVGPGRATGLSSIQQGQSAVPHVRVPQLMHRANS